MLSTLRLAVFNTCSNNFSKKLNYKYNWNKLELYIKNHKKYTNNTYSSRIAHYKDTLTKTLKCLSMWTQTEA